MMDRARASVMAGAWMSLPSSLPPPEVCGALLGPGAGITRELRCTRLEVSSLASQSSNDAAVSAKNSSVLHAHGHSGTSSNLQVHMHAMESMGSVLFMPIPCALAQLMECDQRMRPPKWVPLMSLNMRVQGDIGWDM